MFHLLPAGSWRSGSATCADYARMKTTGETARALLSEICRGPKISSARCLNFEFENWAVIALGGIPNKVQVGDMGIDGKIYPVGAMPTETGKSAGELDFMDEWYPVQVKQLDQVGRPDIDKFEAAMIRANRKRGFFVGFDYTQDATTEAGRFFRSEHREITLFTVRDILDEQIARKLV
jgi:hypothetical protein